MNKKDLFIKRIQDQFGEQHIRILQHLYEKPPYTFRINTNKATSAEVLPALRKQGFNIKIGPLENSYIVVNSPKDIRITQTDFANNGQIYIQKMSSMIPVKVLAPKEDEKILDLCASPGSKTTQLLLETDNKVQIVAVENNRARLYKLKDNLRIQGFTNVQIIQANAATFTRKYSQYKNFFDKVLADVPCSNEGNIFLNEPKTYEYWNPKASKGLSKLQKKIIFQAYEALSPGGVLVYSTCTFNKQENDDVVDWLIKKFPQTKIEEKKLIIPDGVFTGFFVAKLIKN